MLDYKNNTQEHFENIDKYIKSLEDEKEILLNAIRTLKGKTPLQGSLFDEYNDFIELAAYEVDDILSAGEKPYSLFAQDQIICELRDSGVTTIINLMQEHEFSRYNSEVLDKEFNLVNIPIVGNNLPDINTLHKIIYTIDKSKKTYIHCDGGLGRVGVVVGYYLYEKYGYRGCSIIQKIEKFKEKSKLASQKSPSSSEQIKFVLELD
jgi:hypothetical protein